MPYPPCNTKTGRRQTQATPRDLADSIIPTWAKHFSELRMIYAATSKRVLQIGTIAVLSPVASRRRLSHAGQTDQQHKANNQQNTNRQDA